METLMLMVRLRNPYWDCPFHNPPYHGYWRDRINATRGQPNQPRDNPAHMPKKPRNRRGKRYHRARKVRGPFAAWGWSR